MKLPPFFLRDPMEGDPPCHWANFLSPHLRRFPRSEEKIHWQKHLGHGGEGIVEAVTFGNDSERFALKLFYRTGPLPSAVGNEHGMWSLQGEALTVATLEQVCAGLRNAAPLPVFVPRQRVSRLDALSSLYACSSEGRQSDTYAKLPDQQRITLSDLFAATRVRRCFGWVRLHGESLCHLNRKIKVDERRKRKGEVVPVNFEPGKHYFGIVYEYVPPTEFDMDAVQRQIDFFYYAGFRSCQPANKANWQGPGIKLDFGDYRTPIDPRFDGSTYSITPTEAWYILEMDDPCPDELSTNEREKALDKFDRELFALQDKAAEVERAYCARYYATGRGRPKPAAGYGELDQDVLHLIRVPKIEPPTVRKVWREHHKADKQYLAWLAETEVAEPRKA